MKSNVKLENQIAVTTMKSMMENMVDMVFIKDRQLVYTGASKSFAKLVGLDDASDIIGKRDSDVFHDEALIQRYINDDHWVLSTGKPLEAYIEATIDDNGLQGYCQTSKFPLLDESGEIIGLYGISHDVTREYKAKLNYEQELNALFELPEDALGAALYDVTNWRIVNIRISDARANNSATFNTVDEFIQNYIDSVVDDEEARDFYRSCTRKSFLQKFEEGKRRMSIEYRRRFSDSTILWVHNDLYLLSDPVNGNLCVMSIVRNIDKEKRAAYALARAAQRDALTGIYNRETTMNHIYKYLEGQGKNGVHLLFMIDVDNFKYVNDNLGHQIGDDALVHIAGILRKVFRNDDIVGRIGGDEFFALMKNAENEEDVHKLVVDLMEALQYECSDGKAHVDVSGSVGISRYLRDSKSLEQLYAEADEALLKAKQLGKNCYVFADDKMKSWEERAPLTTVNLRTLLENMDASMFQTELDAKQNLTITYSSHKLFLDTGENQISSKARGEDIWEVILEEDKRYLEENIRKATANNEILDCICRIRNRDGKIEWRHVCGTQLPDEGDHIRRMVHVVTDITNQKEIEAELREKNSIIDVAMRNSDINLWYFDYKYAKCQLTASCQKAHEMIGVDELMNFPECLFEIGYVREDCIDMLRDAYKSLHETGETVEFDVWFRKADGSGWWCERDIISSIIDENGKVIRGIGIGKDVTAEKLLEEKYESFGAYRRLAEKNTRVSFRMNLTTNWIGDCVSSIQAAKNAYPADTVDEFFELILDRIITMEDKKYFNEQMGKSMLLEAFSNGTTLKSIECHYRVEDGNTIWVRITIEMMQNPVTNDIEALLYSFDIDHEKNMQFLVDKLLDDDYEFLGLIDVNTGRLMVFGEGMDDPLMAQNGGIYNEEEQRVFRGLIIEEYYEEGIRNMAFSHVLDELKTKDYYSCSFPARDYAHSKAGRKQWKFAYLDDSKSKVLMSRSDITSIYTAEYDSLTGLYNRETFYRRVRELLDTNTNEQFILIRFDIDRFKAYNDVHGTQAGDHLLAAVGRGVREKIWPNASVFGRLEADHFVSVMPAAKFDEVDWNSRHIEWLNTIAKNYRLTSSIGVYQITDPSIEVSLMCDRALLAQALVKDNYTQKVAWYNASLRDKLMKEQSLVDDMDKAITEGQFLVYLQPLFDYETHTITGAEALVRWNHPTQGLIPPGEFIPLFEKNGFILKLDRYVWEKCCETLKNWQDQHKAMVPISVNVSRCNLYDANICNQFIALIKRYELPFARLNLEITESAYMDDPEQLIGIVKQLRSAGFIVEMDDFGAGYSSLNMLKDMPVDVLKLDTLFISESVSNERSATILSSIIQMAHQLNLSVTAEGVETEEQANSLYKLGCHKMQGYHFGKPMSIDEFEKLLNSDIRMDNIHL